MSYEEKMRDLMARLAAMSPEPPTFPEETPVARPETRKRPRPALAFAAAAALVAILAVPLLLFTGDQDPIAVETTTTTTTLVTTTTSSGVTTTTTPSTTTTSVPAPSEVNGVVYLYQEPERSFSGNPALVAVPVVVQVQSEQVDFLTAWQRVREGGAGLPDGLSTAVPADVGVEATRVEGDVIIAEMSDAFSDGAASPGLLSDFTMLNQLVFTLTHDNPNRSVQFTVGGEPVAIFGTEGIELTSPVGREDFLDWVHVINLTSPIMRQGEGGYLVKGIANVFEATVSIAVLDGEGEETHEEFATASCGTGCWGEFEVVLDPELITPGESSIRLFQHSAQDGSVVDAITIPVAPDGAWRFTVGG